MTLDLADLELAGMTGELEPDELEAATPDAPAPPAVLTQRVTVVMDDGTEYSATLDARDRRAYALMADRYKLPAFKITPGDPNPDVLLLELLTVFSAWYATRHRLGLHKMDWPAFSATAVDITVHAHEDPVAHPPRRGVA